MKYLCSFCRAFLVRNYKTSKFYLPRYSINCDRFYSTDNFGSGRKIYTDLSQYPVERIRNFSIIAHIDHGKSTLADRLLEITDTIPRDKSNKQVLDKLQVERERGITVKAQTASLIYNYKGEDYLLNLIDTPGHVDFNYEVSRSLAACQGVVLLVDANQGVQAQTVANFYMAFESNLVIIPVLNKIDLKGAQPDIVTQQMKTLFDIDPQTVHKISAKAGTGVEELLHTVIEDIPPPNGSREAVTRALLFDSTYDQYKGVVGYFSIIDGMLTKGNKITSYHNKKTYEIQDLGFMHPLEEPTNSLYAGQVGYIICNMRNAKEAQVGDTYYLQNTEVQPLPGFKAAKPMVFAGIYPSDQSEFNSLRNAIEKLTLNDASVSVHIDSSPALGQGFRLGYLGLLHMDVFSQRLEQEHNASVITSCPNVPYKIKIKGAKNIKKFTTDEITILNPCHLPDKQMIVEMSEPVVTGTILMPDDYIGDVTSLCLERRGEIIDQSYIDNKRIMIKLQLPLNEILIDFYDELKSLTSGYASFDYEDAGYKVSTLVKVDFLINNKAVDELSIICHTSRARVIAKNVCVKLTESIPKQLFTISVQGAVGGKILARQDIKALRKDVLAKCYGGDITRKEKLLKRQAEGKKKMRKIGKVEIPKDAFINALKR